MLLVGEVEVGWELVTLDRGHSSPATPADEASGGRTATGQRAAAWHVQRLLMPQEVRARSNR
jgi:hypothetical protein